LSQRGFCILRLRTSDGESKNSCHCAAQYTCP
jgi:hypothetical protein